MLNNILEISNRSSKNGRVRIKISLLKINKDEKETNKNGLHWKEEYVLNSIDSVKGMPLCASFIDEETKEVPYDHGYTGDEVDEDGVSEPLFLDSEVVGSFDYGAIEDVVVNGETIRALCGYGSLYAQRYPALVKWVRKNFALGKVDTSIEIMGLDINDNKIVYEEKNPTEKYRTPMQFAFSGCSLLSVQPGDDNAIVLECAQKNQSKEDNTKMDFNIDEIKSIIQSTITELNNDKKVYEDKITELNSEIASKDEKIKECESTIESKDSEINTLTATVEQVQKALDDLKKEHETYWSEREALEKELGKLKAEKRIAEMNNAISVYTEDEQKFAESEINSFKENPLDGDINAITSKICVGIVTKQKEDARISEINSKGNHDADVDDIFSEMCSEETNDDEDIDIFN